MRFVLERPVRGRPVRERPVSGRIAGRALTFAAAAVLTIAAGGCAPEPDPSTSLKRPSILFILYDDVDIVGDLGPYAVDPGGADPDGAEPNEVQTPFSDRLGREGKRFDRFYVNAPVCSPTRIGLLTGRHPARLGFTWASDELSRRGIPLDVPSLPRLLARSGYRTGAFGKWHIGHATEEIAPSGVGFERSAIDCGYTNLGRGTAGGGYADATFCRAPGEPIDGDPPGTGTAGVPPGTGTAGVPPGTGTAGVPPASAADSFATTRTVGEALRFITETLDPPSGDPSPFYAQIWLHAPHRPLTCPPGYECPDCKKKACDRDEKRRIHHAMIAHAEEQLMRLRRELESRGLWRETLVILASDNGGVGAWQEPSGRLRGEKGSLHERGIRTPLIIAGPGIEPGVVTQPVAGSDLLPTLAELLDLETGFSPADFSLDGLSFADLLSSGVASKSEERKERALFWDLRPDSRFDEHSATGEWRRYAVQKRVGDGVYKLVQDDLWGGGALPQLFELSSDEGESRDLSWKEPIRRHLLGELRHWRASAFRVEPRLASLEGAVTRRDEMDLALDFDGGVARLEEQPALHVGRFDLSVALEIVPSAREEASAWIVGREDSWSLRLVNDRLVFEIEGHRPQRLVHPLELRAGERYRVVATIENRVGLSLYVGDRAARARVRFGRVPQTDEPIQLGRAPGGGEAFRGRIADLAFYSTALQVDDLELDGLGHVDFETAFDEESLGVSVDGPRLSADAAFRGERGLVLFRFPVHLEGWTVPESDRASELQLSAWARTAEADPDASVEVHLQLFCLDEKGEGIDGFVSRHLASGEWRRLVMRYLCPAGTRGAEVLLFGSGDTLTFWDDVRLGALGQAPLDVDFEGVDFDGVDFEGVDFEGVDFEGQPGLVRRPGGRVGYGLAMSPSGSASTVATPRLDAMISATRSFEVSVWAREELENEEDPESGKPASLRLEATCLDPSGAAMEVEVANGPDGRRVLSNPGRVDGFWQQFRLWSSCPAGAEKVGVRVLAQVPPEKSRELVIDELAVVTH